MADSYLRTTTMSKRIGGVVVSVMQTGDHRDGATTVSLVKGEATIELFPGTVAEIAKAVKEMIAILETDE